MADAPEARSWDRHAAWAVVVLVCAVSAWLRFRFLAGFETPVGIDGYYYPIQVRALSETGALYYPSAPLVPWLMWLASALTDPITGSKLVAALGTAAIGIPIMGACRQLHLRPWPSAVGAVMAATSGSCLYLAVEFAKSGVALTVAMAALWAVLATAGRVHRIAVASLAVLATVLAHKLATGLLVALLAPHLYRRARISSKTAVALAVALAGAVVLGLCWPERFLSMSSLAPLFEMWTWDATWSAAIYDPGGQPLSFGGDVLLSAGAAIAVVVAGWRLQARLHSTILAAAAVAVVVALPFIDVADTNGLGPRLRLTAFVPGALCTAALAQLLYVRYRAFGRATLAGVVVGLMVARPHVPAAGVVVPNPDMLRALARLPEPVHAGDRVLIIPDRQLVFANVWLSRVETRLRPEGVAPERRVRLLPAWATGPELVAAIRSATADPPPGLPPPIPVDRARPLTLTAIAEPTWEWLLTRVPPAERARLRRWPTP